MDERPQTVGGYVYTLSCTCHPGDGVRYVGKTTTSLNTRFRGHRRDALRLDEHRKPVHRWMREHGIENIEITLLEAVPEKAMLSAREIRWTAVYRGQGQNLLNANNFWTVGNDGVWHRTSRIDGSAVNE